MSDVLAMLRADIGVARHSDWLLVDQTMIDRFADVTLDRQYIHVDPARAVATPFGGTIAHGFLTLSLLSRFAETTSGGPAPEVRMSLNYGFDRVRFILRSVPGAASAPPRRSSRTRREIPASSSRAVTSLSRSRASTSLRSPRRG